MGGTLEMQLQKYVLYENVVGSGPAEKSQGDDDSG